MLKKNKIKQIKMKLVTNDAGTIIGLDVPDKTINQLEKIAKKYNVSATQIIKEFLDSNFNIQVLENYGITLKL